MPSTDVTTPSTAAPPAPPPETLHRRVDGALRECPDLDSTALAIAVSNRTVELLGEVGSHAERLAAQEIAQGVGGVEAVDNRLRVRASASNRSIADDQISSAIEESLASMSTIDLSHLSFRVLQHVVDLEGSIASAQQRAVVRHVVETVPGVDFVNNRLSIGS